MPKQGKVGGKYKRYSAEDKAKLKKIFDRINKRLRGKWYKVTKQLKTNARAVSRAKTGHDAAIQAQKLADKYGKTYFIWSGSYSLSGLHWHKLSAITPKKKKKRKK